jgi:hypothetical protein
MSKRSQVIRKETTVLTLSVLFSLAVCQAQLVPPPQTLSQIASTKVPFESGGKVLGVWSNGALLAVDDEASGSPVFLAFDKDGKPVTRSRLSIPDAGTIELRWGGFARGMDGSIVACGSAYSHDSRGANFIVWISEDGQQQRVLRLTDFVPHKVGVGPDGTVWAAGRDKVTRRIVMRRYDRQGNDLGSTDLAAERSVGQFHSLYHSYIVTSPDRIGWYSAGARQYIEFDVSGTVLYRFTTEALGSDQRLSGVGLSTVGDLFVATRRVGNTGAVGWEISVLDKSNGVWRKISRPEAWGYLYGCDGNALVVTTHSGVLAWLLPPQHP